MNALFQNILEASLHGGVVIAVVLLARFALKKAPKKYICLLWLLAALRLLMPFEIQSGFSLQPDLNTVQIPGSEYAERVTTGFDSGVGEVITPSLTDLVPTEGLVQDATVNIENNVHVYEREVPLKVLFLENYETIIAWVWLTVAVGMLGYSVLSYLRLRRRVGDAVILAEGIWVSGRVDSPFVMGFFRPRIYLNPSLSERNREYVLAHEKCHIRRGDHWWKWLGFITLALHWFNPLVWLGYILLCRDLEMACDEAVVREMEVGERKAYSAALLTCSARRNTIAACPVAFGEVSVKGRIQNVLNYRKPKFWLILAAVVAVVVIAVCFLTSPVQDPGVNELPEWVNNIDSLLVERIVAMGSPLNGDDWYYEFNRKEMNRMLRSLKTVSGTVDAESSIEFDFRIHLYIIMEDGTVLRMINDDNHNLWVDGVDYTVDEDWLRSWPQSGEEVPPNFHMFCGKMATVAQLTEQKQALLDRVTTAVNNYQKQQETSYHMTISYENVDMDDEVYWYVNGDYAIVGSNWCSLKKDGIWFTGHPGIGGQWQMRQNSVDPYIIYIDPIQPDTVSEISSSMDENGNTVIVINSLWGERGNGLAASQQCTYTLNAQGALIACVYRSEWYDENGDSAENWPQVSWQIHDTSPQEIRNEIDRLFAEVDIEALTAENWGISILTSNVSTTGMKWYFVQAGGSFEGDLFYDQAYTLDRWDEAAQEWVVVDPIDDVAMDTKALILPKDTTTVLDIDWEWLYGPLPNGTYRISKDVWQEQESRTFTVYFGVEDGDEAGDSDTTEAIDIAGKVFTYEKDGFGGSFHITINVDGTFSYYEGLLSSYIGMGNWALDGDTLILCDEGLGDRIRYYYFQVTEDALIFQAEKSHDFMYVDVADGDRFCLSGDVPQQELTNETVLNMCAEAYTELCDAERFYILVSTPSNPYPFGEYQYVDGENYYIDALPESGYNTLKYDGTVYFYVQQDYMADKSIPTGWMTDSWVREHYGTNLDGTREIFPWETGDWDSLGLELERWERQDGGVIAEFVEKADPDHLWSFKLDGKGDLESITLFTKGKMEVQWTIRGINGAYIDEIPLWYAQAVRSVPEAVIVRDQAFYEELFTRQTDGHFTTDWIGHLYEAFYAEPEDFARQMARKFAEDPEQIREVLTCMGYEAEFYEPERFSQTLADLRNVADLDLAILDLMAEYLLAE